jgi:hypothetical protein
MFGLLQITAGPMAGEWVPFMADDLYVKGFNVGFCNDLSKILDVGEEVPETSFLLEFRIFKPPWFQGNNLFTRVPDLLTTLVSRKHPFST